LGSGLDTLSPLSKLSGLNVRVSYCPYCLDICESHFCHPCQKSLSFYLYPNDPPISGWFRTSLNTDEIAITQSIISADSHVEWLKMGCILAPDKIEPLKHSTWKSLCYFNGSQSLKEHMTSTQISESELWKIAQKALELLILLENNGYRHGSLNLKSMVWKPPHLFWNELQPKPIKSLSATGDLNDLADVLLCLSQQRTTVPKEMAFTWMPNALRLYLAALRNEYSSPHEALKALLLIKMSPAYVRPMPDKGLKKQDPLFDASWHQHLQNVKRRSWWQTKDRQKEINPGQVLVLMSFSICIGVALILGLWNQIQGLYSL
jgi:hypothetical protein